jgi:Zn-dependent protease with chaperone function
LNESDQGFEAWLSRPEAGEDAAAGTVRVDPRCLRFVSRDITVEIPLQRLTVDFEPRASGPVQFSDSLKPGLKCSTVDREVLNEPALTQSRHVRAQLERILGRGEIWRRVRLTLYAALAFGLLAWMGSLAIGAMVDVIVNRIPPEWEQKIGEEDIARLRTRMTFVDDTNRLAQLRSLAAPLLRVVPLGGTEAHFYLVENPFPNAFALPGGQVVVTTGLLDTVDSPEELLGVLAHELAHVVLKHGFRHMISGLGPILILQIFLSNRNNRLDLLSQSSGLLIARGFSQEYEREADETGWNYLVAANINPHGMIDMFEKFRALHEDDVMLGAFSSHPALEQRIQWLQAKWVKLPRHDGFIDLTNAIPGSARGDSGLRLPGIKARH